MLVIVNSGSSQGEVAGTSDVKSLSAAPTVIAIVTMPSIQPRLRFLSKHRFALSG